MIRIYELSNLKHEAPITKLAEPAIIPGIILFRVEKPDNPGMEIFMIRRSWGNAVRDYDQSVIGTVIRNKIRNALEVGPSTAPDKHFGHCLLKR
jgi:hypothetical protein